MNLSNLIIVAVIIVATLDTVGREPDRFVTTVLVSQQKTMNQDASAEINKTFGLIVDDLKSLKAKYPQLAEIDKANISESQLAYTHGKVGCPSKAKPCAFSENACRLTVNIEQLEKAEDANKHAAFSREIKMRNGKFLSVFYQVLAEPTEKGKRFERDANKIIATRLNLLIDRVRMTK